MRLCWGRIAIGIILLFAQPLSAADLNKADILKITDGDTVLLAVNGEEIKLRLLEIDCFENKPNLRAKWQAENLWFNQNGSFASWKAVSRCPEKIVAGQPSLFLRETQRKRCLPPLSWYSFYYPQ